MNYTVRFSDAAEDDVIELLTYLLPRAGERVARLYVDQIVDHCHSFERFPERGSRLESKLGVRLVGYRRKATIAFMIKGDTVTILRIFHHGRNIDFDPEDPDPET
ncbi:plasmid stabilization system protein ParE [Rhizobium soli]|uniref:Plasmid stabilization system protein ParE n=1 Tax=Rhizobium soli TaxID=424798 RepID=A0A7X0MT83_9HYPH|nr:type II toxin-antitoxin system RelE/ParE family toxin [Rhizobium soli]MBB6508970.1 plasmid stabilization system protein ParE [Rhizobium soli]